MTKNNQPKEKKEKQKKEKIDKPKKVRTEKPKRAREGTQYEKTTSKGIITLERTNLPPHEIGAWRIVGHRSAKEERRS